MPENAKYFMIPDNDNSRIYLYSEMLSIPGKDMDGNPKIPEYFCYNHEEGAGVFNAGEAREVVPVREYEIDRHDPNPNKRPRVTYHAPVEYARWALTHWHKRGLIRLAGPEPTEKEREISKGLAMKYMDGLVAEFNEQARGRAAGKVGQIQPEPFVQAYAQEFGRDLLESAKYNSPVSCPYCAEIVAAAAIKCRHCGEKLVSDEEYKARAVKARKIAAQDEAALTAFNEVNPAEGALYGKGKVKLGDSTSVAAGLGTVPGVGKSSRRGVTV